MGLHRGLGDEQRRCDPGVVEPAGHEAQHLSLPLRQRVELGRDPGCRRRTADVLLDEALGQRRRQQRLSRADGLDADDEAVGRGGLEQEPGGTRAEAAIYVGVDVVRGQHEDPCLQSAGRDLAGGSDAVEHRHPDVHQHHVGAQRGDHVDCLATVAGLVQDIDTAGLQTSCELLARAATSYDVGSDVMRAGCSRCHFV